MKKYYNYVLKSLKDNRFYIGYTANFEKRMKDHKNGQVISTRYRRPFMLMYNKVSFNLASVIHREKYLKTTYGHRYLKNRLGENPQGLPL